MLNLKQLSQNGGTTHQLSMIEKIVQLTYNGGEKEQGAVLGPGAFIVVILFSECWRVYEGSRVLQKGFQTGS